MSTAGGDDTAAQGNPSAAAHQPRAADNQNPTTATSNLVSPPPQQTKDKGSKKRKKDTSIDSFMSPAATSSSSMATKKSEYKKRVATETNQLIHEFVNNGAHPDTVVTNGDFRALIDHLIEHGQDLKGHYKHMGQRKYVSNHREIALRSPLRLLTALPV